MEASEKTVSGWAPWVWLNGDLVPGREARVSVFDRGFLHGDGVYETVRASAGKVFRWPPHRDRLARSLSGARMALPFPMATLEAGIGRCLEANGLREARIRLTVSRGEGSPGIEVSGGPAAATVVVAASAWKPLSAGFYRDGVPAIVSRVRQTGRESLDPALKSTSRIHLVLARLEASEGGAHEAILLSGAGEVAEGTSSNVFLVRAGGIRTPSVDTGILEGVTREAVLELARLAGLVAEETRISREELESAEEIFVTNTSWGVLPVARLDGKPVGAGRPGMVAADLGRRLAALMGKECGE